jgi:hypothetical protein
MSRPRINVTDHVVWGRLVKTWATGKNYIDHVVSNEAPVPTTVEKPPKFPKPNSFEDFVAQCKAVGVGLFFDDRVNNLPVQGNEGMGFLLLQANSDTAVLRLPAKDKIEESEDRFLNQGEKYTLPPFYTRVFGTVPKDSETDSNERKAVLHAERVGEYTINTCA